MESLQGNNMSTLGCKILQVWSPVSHTEKNSPPCPRKTFMCRLTTISLILRFVVASSAEAKLRALFLNCQERMIFKSTLEDLGYPQPKIPVCCDNAPLSASQTTPLKGRVHEQWKWDIFEHVKKMRKMCILLNGTPEWKILLITRVNITVLFTREYSPLELPHAILRPSTLKGCVGTPKHRYVGNVPLPRVPQIQSASPTTSHESIAPKAGIPLPGYFHVPSWIPTLPKLGSILGFSQR